MTKRNDIPQGIEAMHQDRAGVVVLVNTGKSEALERLQRVAANATVHVVTEAAYVSKYPRGTPMTIVKDVGRVSDVLDAVAAVHRGSTVTHVVSPSERSMPAGGYVRDVFALGGIGSTTANLLTNKFAMKQRLVEHGLPVAEHRVTVGREQLSAAARMIGFPVIIKPAFGTGSMDTHVLADEDTLARLLASESGDRISDSTRLMIVERYMTVGDELTCDGIVVRGKVEFALASLYNTPLLGGIGQMLGASTLRGADALAQEVRELHARTVSALGIEEGVTHMEMLRTSDGLLVGEIACRPGGAGVVDSARLSTGVDLWDAFMSLSLGHAPEIANDGSDPAPLMWTTLPTWPGRVVSLADENAFRSVDGMQFVDMHIRVGDEISSRMHSSTTTGIVYCRLDAPDRRQVADRLRQIENAYFLDTRPPAEEQR
ncbi:ATP-grasp domain-containing protein [Microbacterium sp. LWO12-1.2]|uniref:ATP-grasp domain-containing protein n=1 Tax=Microbacterium sp. LWO12-1.2 TaxID=3135261 RepID=UPI00343505B2